MPRSKSAKRKLELWQERTRKFFRTHPSGVRPGTMTAPNMFPGLHGGSDLNPTAGVPGINHSFSVDSNNDGGVSGGSTAAAVCGNNDSGDSGTSDVSVDDDGGITNKSCSFSRTNVSAMVADLDNDAVACLAFSVDLRKAL